MIPDFRPFLKQNTKEGKNEDEENKLQKPLSNLPRRFSKKIKTKIKEDLDDYLKTDPTEFPATKKALTLTRRPRTRGGLDRNLCGRRSESSRGTLSV